MRRASKLVTLVIESMRELVSHDRPNGSVVEWPKTYKSFILCQNYFSLSSVCLLCSLQSETVERWVQQSRWESCGNKLINEHHEVMRARSPLEGATLTHWLSWAPASKRRWRLWATRWICSCPGGAPAPRAFCAPRSRRDPHRWRTTGRPLPPSNWRK